MAVLIWLGAGVGASAQARGAEAFQQGVEAFELKNFAEAKDALLSVVEKEQLFSPDLGFYLGNTFFRLDEFGRAALWYRRALVRDPGDPALRQNLRLIQRRTGALEFQPTFGMKLAGLMKHREWRWLFAGGVWLAALAATALVFTTTGRRHRWLFAGVAVVAGLAAGVAAWGVWGRVPVEEIARRAVVVQAGAVAQAAPTGTAGVIIDLPPGSEVTVTEERDAWTCVTIPGAPERGVPERVGWVRREALERLWPYAEELVE